MFHHFSHLPCAGVGHVMAQMVSWPVTAEAQIHTRVSPCRICDGQGGTGTGFSPSSLVFPESIISTMALQTHISPGR
jgi:hypothetical protein